MKRSLRLPCLILSFTLVFPVNIPADDFSDFKALLTKFWEAWSTLDPDKAAGYYAKDAGLVFYDVAPLKYSGWNEYKAGVLKVFGDYSGARIKMGDDLKVNRHGSLAWTTNTVDAALTPKTGAEENLKLRHTAIWEKRGANWVILHEHASAPLPEEPPQK